MIHAPSVIGRNLDSMTKSDKEVKIDPGATIGGKKKLEFFKTQPSQYRTFSFYTKQALRIGAAFLMGLLLYWIIPGMRRISLSTGRALLTSGGIGFLAAVAAPIAAIIAGDNADRHSGCIASCRFMVAGSLPGQDCRRKMCRQRNPRIEKQRIILYCSAASPRTCHRHYCRKSALYRRRA